MSVALKRIKESRSTLQEAVAKYPDVPGLIILKIDVQRRGVHYTQRALDAVDPAVHQIRTNALFGSRDGEFTPRPESLLLRDGTSIVVDSTPVEKNPYLVDFVDGRFALTDGEELLEFVDLWEKPKYYDLETSSGTPMANLVTARPQRFNILGSSFCHFVVGDKQCRYCDIGKNYKQLRQSTGIPARANPREVAEIVREGLKETGRFTTFCITGGSVLKGVDLFDQEVEWYIELLQAIGENFETKKFPSQLIASAFNERQLRRLYDETGLMSYTSDIEVLNEEKFNWICPGKAESVGYREWKRRLFKAVEIFGRGNVATGIVGGVELARPFGFESEAEALRSTLEEAETFAAAGVPVLSTVWLPRPGSLFSDQQNPSLDYYVQLFSGLHQLRASYGLTIDFDDYRRCGNHADTDLSRIL
ncbi:MAG: radical SAM protein [Chlorobiaceae bacterium]|nr:radical SAM protein [Chlorobiaceae bacterium]